MSDESSEPGLDYEIQRDVLSSGYDRETEWFQPRAGIIPPATVVLTMTRARLWGSDIFTAVQEFRSDDLGKTWDGPRIHPALDRRLINGVEVCPCDLTPAWHAVSGKLLMIGQTACYEPGERGALLLNNRYPRDTVYAVYDARQRAWSQWRIMDLPDRERFFWAVAGCAQRVDLPDGDILQPLHYLSRAGLGDNFWKSRFATIVVRCAFDGDTLRYCEHGEEMSVPEPRGLYESSLTSFQGRFFLTMRNDQRGYVAVGRDGLNFDPPIPWTFDDGEELGSYNTQQHWVTHSDGLFLVYTRRNAGNDEVIRHRAPLFMARVDPERLCVIRDTERTLIPNRGAQLGNFGTVNISPDESLVVTSEGMHGDAGNPMNLDLTEKRGADNRVYLCRIHWNRPNRLA